MPLKFYEDLNAFKIFVLDVGLLGAMSEMDPAQMLMSSSAMTESKGAFTGELCTVSTENNGWNAHLLLQPGRLQTGSGLHRSIPRKDYPIEVKAEENLKAKSLKAFMEKHTNLHAIRFQHVAL